MSMPDVDAELMPVVRMTNPRGYERLDRVPLVPGRRLFRSVLLLYGVLPVDVHAIAPPSLTPGRGFLESSSSLLHRRWIHERVIEPDSGGARLSRPRVFRMPRARPWRDADARCAPSSVTATRSTAVASARARAAAKPHRRSAADYRRQRR